MGSGQQWMSWVSLADAVRAIQFAIQRADLEGPANVCSPAPARNADFARALGGAMGRPAVLPLPAAAVRAVFGEMGEETLLVSQRAVPDKLERAGFRFLHAGIDDAMAAALREG